MPIHFIQSVIQKDLGSLVTGANDHDSRMLEPLMDQLIKNVGKPTALAVDAGYKTPPIAKFLMGQEIRPVMPYTRPKTKNGYMKNYEYVYDEYYDQYICPRGLSSIRFQFFEVPNLSSAFSMYAVPTARKDEPSAYLGGLPLGSEPLSTFAAEYYKMMK